MVLWTEVAASVLQGLNGLFIALLVLIIVAGFAMAKIK